MRDKLLKTLADLHSSHPRWMLIIVLFITVIMVFLAQRLTLTMRTSDLLPEGDPRVIQFNKIIEEFATATNLVIVVQGEEEQIKAFADELAPKILTLRDSSLNKQNKLAIDKIQEKIRKIKANSDEDKKMEEYELQISQLKTRMDMPLFQRVDYKAEIEFMKNHLLMLIKAEDLENTKDVFMDPNLTGLITNLNNSMEKEYIGQEEAISTREKEDGAVVFLDGIENLICRMREVLGGGELTDREIRLAADKLLFGEPYMLSYDKTALVMIAIPNFSIMERDLLMIGTKAVQNLVDDQIKNFPNIRAGLSGPIAREHDETVYAEKTISYSTIVAFIFILILLMVAFRMWIAPIFAMLTLLAGVIWALGASYIVVGHLNLLTAMMSIILLGLGIDFAIHFISGFTERRAAGDQIPIALQNTFLKNARGIITGASTTACAFLTLMISQARGMRELGLVIGIGLISILLTTLIFLPVMLVLRERYIDKRRGQRKVIKRDISFKLLGKMCDRLSRHYVFSICAAIVITFLLSWPAFKMRFDHNLMNLEPEGLISLALMDTVMDKFDLNMEYSLILTDDVEESRELSEKCRSLGSVALTDDISLYLPSSQQQAERNPHILEVRQKMRSTDVNITAKQNDISNLQEEIKRLEMNVMEMQDLAFLGGHDKIDEKCKKIVGDPDNPESRNIIQELLQLWKPHNPSTLRNFSRFQNVFSPYFKKSVLRMASTEPLSLAELPESVLDRYSNKTRQQFLITVFPSGNLWENREFLNRFAADVDRVSNKVTGSAPLFIALITIFGRDGLNAILLTLVLVFLLLWFDFKSPRFALIAMLPLACGIFWMLGLMKLSGMLLNLVNLMGLPLIIGIGIDDGVHIVHRWRYEGAEKIRVVFSSTGKAIFLTSLTTMFAFGSLHFSVYRGWASFGTALFLGVGACFLTTIFLLPGILGLVERKNLKDSKLKNQLVGDLTTQTARQSN